MWDGHLGHISVAKHHIELLDYNYQRAHLEPYRAGPKKREFQTTKIDKVLKDNIVKLAQS